MRIKNSSFIDYVDGYPELSNGLWGVVEIVLRRKLDISQLKQKYADVHFEYIKN